MDELLQGVRAGRRRAVARLITRIENEPGAARAAVSALHPHTGRAHVVGVTGSPGSGKSSLVNELAKQFRAGGRQVGIVAVDPSSPFTGGALLGDRVRMRDLSGDDGIFIRSMASRGSLGGLAEQTTAVVKVLDAAGFDIVVVETVGAGQAEVDIANAAHTTIVIEAPGMGDEIQSIKAGILEIADILVVNMADRPGSNRTIRALQMMLHLNPGGATMRHHGRLMAVPDVQTPPESNGDAPAADGWQVPVLPTVAVEGTGVAELAEAIVNHGAYLRESGEWLLREKERTRQEITQLLQARLMARLAGAVSLDEQEALLTAVAERRTDPYTAVDALFARALPG